MINEIRLMGMDKNMLEELLRKIVVEELGRLSLSAPSKYLTPKEICEQFRISRKTFYDWLHKGRFPMHKMGNRSYVVLEEFEKGMHKIQL